MSGLEKWERMRDGLVVAAVSAIGYESRRQSDWFKDNASVLKELIECRNMFGRWLKSGNKGTDRSMSLREDL